MSNLQTFGFSALASALITGSFVASSSAEGIPLEFLEDLKSEEFKIRVEAELSFLDWARKDAKSRVHLVLGQAREAADPEVRQRSHNVLYALAMDDYLLEGEGFVGIQMIAVRAPIPGAGEDPKEVIAITRVLLETPAREAGLLVGDMITSVNGVDIHGDDALPEFQNKIRKLKPGAPTRFGIVRDGELIEVNLTLGRRPPDPQGRFLGQPMLDMNELAKVDRDRFFKEWLDNLEN